MANRLVTKEAIKPVQIVNRASITSYEVFIYFSAKLKKKDFEDFMTQVVVDSNKLEEVEQVWENIAMVNDKPSYTRRF